MRPPFVATLLIPTGIGASIGGFGGDGMTVLRALAEICDRVITHPNVANAACFQDMPQNVLYVEGAAIDRFFNGTLRLRPIQQNRVGVVFDAGMEEGMRTLHLNTLDAVASTYGTQLIGPIETRDPIRSRLQVAESGRSCGQIDNLQTLFDACETLIHEGATALALCVCLPELDDDHNKAYGAGEGVDPISGIEAMLSHAVVSRFGLPAANAPVFSWADAEPVRDRRLDARTCAEFITPTFLPCVLQGLQRAPQFVDSSQRMLSGDLDRTQVNALIVPADAMGSIPVLEAIEALPHTVILAVENNTTVMKATAHTLNLPESRVVTCANYLEALAHCVALKAGIRFPAHISRPLACELSLESQAPQATLPTPLVKS